MRELTFLLHSNYESVNEGGVFKREFRERVHAKNTPRATARSRYHSRCLEMQEGRSSDAREVLLILSRGRREGKGR